MSSSIPPSAGAHAAGVPGERDQGATLIRLIAALAIALRVGVSLATRLTDASSLVNLRYAENIASGNGFVYDVGQRVLGTTTPLYTLVLALAIKLGLPGLAVGKALNIAADGALCLVIYAWLRAIQRERAGLLAAFLAAVDPRLIHWSISGMETSLVTVCGVLAFFMYTQKRYRLTYVALAVLFWLRWDSLLLTGVISAAFVLRERRLPWREVTLYGAILAPWLVFATFYFGDPIPVTWKAKAVVYGRLAHGARFPHLADVVTLFCGAPGYALLTAAAVIGLIVVAAKRWTALWPAVAWFAIYWAAFITSKMPLFDRYVDPPAPVYLVLAAVGLCVVGRPLSRLPRAASVALVCAAGGLSVVAVLRAMTPELRAQQAFESSVRAPLGTFIAEHSAETDRVLIMAESGIGTFGYYSRRSILDAKGSVTPEVLPYWGPEHVYPNLDIALAFRPEWCILQPDELQRLTRASEATGHVWEQDYELVQSFSGAGQPTTFLLYRRRRPST